MGFATRCDLNQSAQLMRLARVLKLQLQQVEVLYYLGSEQQRRRSDCADAQDEMKKTVHTCFWPLKQQSPVLDASQYLI